MWWTTQIHFTFPFFFFFLSFLTNKHPQIWSSAHLEHVTLTELHISSQINQTSIYCNQEELMVRCKRDETIAKQTRSRDLNHMELRTQISKEHNGNKVTLRPLGWTREPNSVGLSSTLQTDRHPPKCTRSVLGCCGLRQFAPWVLPPSGIRCSGRGEVPPALLCHHSQSPAWIPTCHRRTRAPWPARGSTGRKPPPRSSSRRTWGRRSASAVGRSSGWAGGSPSPARWWSWRCGLAGCNPRLWRCSPPAVPGEKPQHGVKTE